MKTSVDRRPLGQKIGILISVCLAALTMPLSFTGPAVALSAIGHELGGSALSLNWVSNASMLCFGSTLMVAGTLADRYGRKRLFLLGSGLFAVFSLLLTMASNMVVMDWLRAAQGLAAAAAFSGGVAALAQEFTGPGAARAFSLLGTTFGVGLAFGPLLSGYLVQGFGWRTVFLSTALLDGLAVLLGSRWMHETRDPAATQLDWAGALTFTASLALLTYGILLVPSAGWSSGASLGLLAGALVGLALFVAVELRVARPMLDLSLFRYPRFIGVQCLAAAPAYAYVVLLVLLPARLIGVEGVSELAAGQMMILLSAPMLVVPMLAAVGTRWLSAGTLSALGLFLAAAGLWWLSQYPLAAHIAQTRWPMLLIGLGISFPWGLMDGLAVSVVPKERAGMATGIFSTTRVAGEGIALAVVSLLLAALIRIHLAEQLQAAHAARLSAADLLVVANDAAVGNVRQATAAVPSLAPALLAQAYGSAFQTLLRVLAGMATCSGVLVLSYLDRPHGVVGDRVGAATVEKGAM